ncbi:NADH-quinone oxidoreductase subunit G, partial [bacterium]|nr:NADH-quinone oxidoreductase subunit G [bacterium]
NLEGKLQNAYKASYPPGDAKEDWLIFKELANIMKKPFGFNKIEDLQECIKKDIQLQINKKSKSRKEPIFVNDIIKIKSIDYYHTNPIARSSKIMNECREVSKTSYSTDIKKVS